MSKERKERFSPHTPLFKEKKETKKEKNLKKRLDKSIVFVIQCLCGDRSHVLIASPQRSKHE